MKTNSHTCPVCGYNKLAEPPRNRTGGASLEICACCGFQFGVTDDDQGVSYDDHRHEWIAEGMPWRSTGRRAPAEWNPQTQLAGLALNATLKRVKGRPPRMSILTARES
jgi:hypothetical protein